MSQSDDYHDALEYLDKLFPSVLDDKRTDFQKQLGGTLAPWERKMKPNWIRCSDGGRHNIIRVRTVADCWDQCTKCGMMGD